MKEKKLPVAYLYKKVVFPFCNLTFHSRSKRYRGLKPGDHLIAFPIHTLWDVLSHRRRIGTLSEVVEAKSEGETTTVQVKGLERARIKKLHRLFCASYEVVERQGEMSQDRLREDLRKKSQELVFLINMEESDKLIHLLNFLVNPHQLTDFISNYFVLKFPRRLEMFNELDVDKRARDLIGILGGIISELKARR